MNVVLVDQFPFESVSEALFQKKGMEAKPDASITLLTLAACILREGHDVVYVDWFSKIVDGTLPFDESLVPAAARYLIGLNADCIGFTTRCDGYMHTLDLVRTYKALGGPGKVVLGGPQATVTAVETLNAFPFIDCIALNEADLTLPRLLDVIACKGDILSVPGLALRHRGMVRMTAKPEPVGDLDVIPMAAYHLSPPKRTSASIEVGRGCPFSCTFCSTSTFFSRRYRLKSPERIMREIMHLHEMYGVTEFDFIHDLFTVNKDLVRHVCESLQKLPFRPRWACSARVDCIDEPLLELMYATGCDSIYFGIETGSASMQKIVKKRLKLDLLPPLLDLCERLGIQATTSCIVGYPDETEDDIEQSLALLLNSACRRGVTGQFHQLGPTPGTPMTVENAGHLVYVGPHSNDLTSHAAPWTPEYDATARALPAIFSVYYKMLTKHVPLELLQGIDMFGGGLQKCVHTYRALQFEEAFPRLLDIFKKVQPLICETLAPLEHASASTRTTHVFRALRAHYWSVLEDQPAFPLSLEAAKLDGTFGVLVDEENMPPTAAPEPGAVYCAYPCAVVDMRCNPTELTRWTMANELGRIALDAQAQPFLAVRMPSKRESMASDTRWIRVDAFTRNLLVRCDGKMPVEDLARVLWTTGEAEGASSFERCERLVARTLSRFLREGIVAVGGARATHTGKPPIAHPLRRLERASGVKTLWHTPIAAKDAAAA